MVDEHAESSGLEAELSSLLNRHSAENPSGTPDFILASYLMGCLDVFNKTVAHRGHWRGETTELPALQQLHRDSATMDKVIVHLRELTEEGVITINSQIEATDIFRAISDKPEDKEVPLVTYEGGQRNEIGTAKVKINPGEILVEGKVVTGASALFGGDLKGVSLANDLDEPKDFPIGDRPKPSTFERYMKGEL